FPVTPVYDLLVKENDLVAGTHGRSMWVMDDLTPLHQLLAGAETLDAVHLFTPRTTYRLLPDLFAAYFGIGEGRAYSLGLGKSAIVDGKRGDDGQLAYEVLDAGKGAPQGAVINYYLAEAPSADTKVTLEILDSNGNVVRTFTPKPEGYDKLDDKDKALDPGPWVVTTPGVHRFVWDLRREGATKVRGNKTAGEAATGRFVLPGTYQIKLTVGDSTQRASFTLVNDPRVATTAAELEEQAAVLDDIYAKISAVHEGVNTLRAVREQAKSWADRLAGKERGTAVVEAATALIEKLDTIEDRLILPGEQEDTFGLNEPARLNAKLSSLIPVVGSADRRPTAQAQALFQKYAATADQQLSELHALLNDDLETLNTLIQDANVPGIVI
ncbi:MAG: glycosyl hydrolase, partial [Caldilineaceae bacterium]|nr:glycosyl hydrolase [Caldilineaceae bacterium]